MLFGASARSTSSAMTPLQGAGMQSWMTDASAVPGVNNGATFDNPLDPNPNNILDPSMAFLQTPSALDLQNFQSQQFQQRMNNGPLRNASPAFQNPSYQVPPTVPAKRPRPREDSLGASPRQAPGGLPVSRSQTPHETSFQAFSQAQNAQQFAPQPNPFQHLQHNGSANASPSPIMQNQQPFRPPTSNQRVQTASPNPYSPAAQGFGSQISPSPSDHVARGTTPQNNPSMYMPGVPYGSNFNQHFVPSPGMPAMPQQALSMQQMQPMQNPQQSQEVARNHQMRIQQQRQIMQQAQNMKAYSQAQGMGAMMGAQPAGAQNMRMAGTPTRPPQSMPRPGGPGDPAGFVRSLTAFAMQRGQQINQNPIVSGQRIHLVNLYTTVMREGGSRKVTQIGAWSVIASKLGLAQFSNAPHELKATYEMNLAGYEEQYLLTQQKQRMSGNPGNPLIQQQQQQQHQLQHQPQQPQQHQQPVSQQIPIPLNPQHISPAKQPQPFDGQQTHLMNNLPQGMPASMHTPTKTPTPAQVDSRVTSANGFGTPQRGPMHGRQANTLAGQRASSRPMDSTPPPNQMGTFPTASPGSSGKQNSGANMSSPPMQMDAQPAAEVKKPEEFDPNFIPQSRLLDTYGGNNVSVLSSIGAELSIHRPNAPTFYEMGLIDIHALNMSLQSGIQAEVRLALDALTIISIEEKFMLQLQACDDLVESLIDCADVQVDFLAEHTLEISDDIVLASYEDMTRACRMEVETLQEVSPYGSLECDLEHAVERLICISTILRNLSFWETNHVLLSDAPVIKFLATVIRHLGTRNMLLRNHANTLDFVKDLITFLSNVSYTIHLPSKDEALALLHFLLVFAPSPSPTVSPSTSKIAFSAYSASIHRYLPSAVDSLAKLLARDEPNRAFYRTIFQADTSSTPPYALLTRTFALAISPVPAEPHHARLVTFVDARRAYVEQGMLSASILADLAPGSESGVARAWLESEDGFATNLLRLVCLLAAERQRPVRPHQGRTQEHDLRSYFPIAHRGMAVLCKLAEKARRADDAEYRLPFGVLPKTETLLGTLLDKGTDRELVRQLCTLTGLER